ncbi:MAG TPA: di-heme oxidoredictase family protein [Blastocatellia bacterium]|nr:di-heme oxidoredictase family protein [Blastocatellia bacterium]
MRLLKLCTLACILALACLGLPPDQTLARAEVTSTETATEAPTGFDNLTNGVLDQATFDAVRETFEDTESIADGIGPVYNALSCTECHQNPVNGGNSQVLEVRAGKFANGVFTDHVGGSLIHSRAINAAIQERIGDEYNVRTFRASPSVLGLGFVESIADQTLINIANLQPLQSGGVIRGQLVTVGIFESPGATRIGRFGWKDQQASLFSFSGDAYVNEMGITTPMFPVENTSNGRPITDFDPLPNDPDDADNDDLEAFTDFMRSTKAPPRDAVLAATPDAQAGAVIFNQIGCAICHTTSITTAPAGTVLNGGMFTVPIALGDKIIHPYSDFALHDVGTGDGIVQGFPSARNKVRTSPLWGLRTRGRFMHDGLSLTINEAVLRHSNEAVFVAFSYRFLSTTQRNQIQTFLKSL